MSEELSPEQISFLKANIHFYTHLNPGPWTPNASGDGSGSISVRAHIHRERLEHDLELIRTGQHSLIDFKSIGLL